MQPKPLRRFFENEAEVDGAERGYADHATEAEGMAQVVVILDLEPSGGRFVVAYVKGQMETGRAVDIVFQPRNLRRRDEQTRAVPRRDPLAHAGRVGVGHERVHVVGRVHVATVLGNEPLNQCPGAFGPENVVEELRQHPAPQVQHGRRQLPIAAEVQGSQGNVQCAAPYLGIVGEWFIAPQQTARVAVDDVVEQIPHRAAEMRPDIEVVGRQRLCGRRVGEDQSGQAVDNEVQRVRALASRPNLVQYVAGEASIEARQRVVRHENPYLGSHCIPLFAAKLRGREPRLLQEQHAGSGGVRRHERAMAVGTQQGRYFHDTEHFVRVGDSLGACKGKQFGEIRRHEVGDGRIQPRVLQMFGVQRQFHVDSCVVGAKRSGEQGDSRNHVAGTEPVGRRLVVLKRPLARPDGQPTVGYRHGKIDGEDVVSVRVPDDRSRGRQPICPRRQRHVVLLVERCFGPEQPHPA